MSLSLWLLNGQLVVDSLGRPILCDVCPCSLPDPPNFYPCCVDPIPETLYCTVEYFYSSGNKTQVITLTYDADYLGIVSSSPGAWVGELDCEGKITRIVMYCSTIVLEAGAMVFEHYCDGINMFAPPRPEPGYASMSVRVCDPFWADALVSIFYGDSNFQPCCNNTTPDDLYRIEYTVLE